MKQFVYRQIAAKHYVYRNQENTIHKNDCVSLNNHKQLLLYKAGYTSHRYTQVRHSGRDSHQVILPAALRVNANLFRTDLCRNTGYMEVFKLTIHGTGYPLPGGYDETCIFVCNDDDYTLRDQDEDQV